MPSSIIDSCCVINLSAAGDLLSTLPATLGMSLHVPQKVLEESLYIRQSDAADAHKLVPRAVDLAPLIAAGFLHKCELSGEDELSLFVQFAMTLDDGEAACLAIAKNRGWTFATDDRKARREAASHGVPVLTTPELVKAWADAEKAEATVVAKLLSDIQNYARFVPHRTMPLHAWWMKVVRAGGP